MIHLSIKAADFFGTLFNMCPKGLFLTFFRLDTLSTQYVPLDELKEVTELFIDSPNTGSFHDLFFGVGLQSEIHQPSNKRGAASDVRGISSLWFDLDTKEGKGLTVPLPSRQEALSFLAKLPFQPSIVVDSGYGYHVYWLFREIWDLENQREWKAAAKLSYEFHITLQTWGYEQGWEFDLTSDLSRMLRVPGTVNSKKGLHRLVTVTEFNPDRRYNPSDFIPFLIDSETQGLNSGRTIRQTACLPAAYLNIEPIFEGCNWFRHCVKDAEILSEPEWFAMLNILARIKKGRELAHLFSEPYEKYSREETDWKFGHAASYTGTYSCRKIMLLSGGRFCSECPMQGRIRSPLGFSQREAYAAGLDELKKLVALRKEVGICKSISQRK